MPLALKTAQDFSGNVEKFPRTSSQNPKSKGSYC